MAVNLVIFTLGFVPGILLRVAPFKKLITKKQWVAICIAHTLLLALNTFCLYLVRINNQMGTSAMKVDIFVFGLLLSGVNILILRSHIKEQLFTCGLVMFQDLIIISAVSYLMAKVVKYLTDIDLLLIISIYGLIIQLIFYWFFRKLIVSTVRPFLSLQTDDYLGGIWFVSLIMFLSCFFALPMNVMIDSQAALVTRLLQYIVIVVVCRTMVNSSLSIKENLELEKDLSLQQNHYIELANRIEDARRIRHDFKHRITTIHQYLDNEDYDGLRKYCNEFQSHNNTDVSIPYTGNPAVDGIMYHYATIAKENNISFEYKKINPPKISDIDLCSLLGNALDNAVTACMNVKENPFIQVISNGEGAGMQVLIRNSFDGVVNKKDDKFLTRKTEGDHGIGVSSMQEICDRNDVLMKIAHTDDTFDVLFVF